MCGICGLIYPLTQQTTPYFNFYSKERYAELPITPMIESLRHRGPNDSGAWASVISDQQLLLGQTRLPILDLSNAAQQPMIDSESGCVLVFNGEIYNFMALRAELLRATSIPFTSTGDTEVLLRAYLHWGKYCVNHLRGMFAFAIYDPRQRELFLARDHFGIKPLYMVQGVNGQFAFASEVRALLTLPWIRRTLDPLGLMGYLAYGSVQDPQTLIEGITALPTAHILVIDLTDQRVKVKEPLSFWTLPTVRPEKNNLPIAELAQQVRYVLTDSVRHHLASDVPLGVFLSSGLDSSSIVSLMVEANFSKVHTLTVAFDESPFDESVIARAIAQHYGTQHTEIRLTAATFLNDMPTWLASQDQPSADGSNTWIISRACREAGLTVALSGLGGDELFAGYSTFQRTARATQLFKTIALLPHALRRKLATYLENFSNRSPRDRKLLEWIRSDGSNLSTYLILRRMFVPSIRQQLLDPSLLSLTQEYALHPSIVNSLKQQAVNPDVIASVSFMEMSTYLVNTLLRDSDQMSMAHSLEIRVPFIDSEVVKLVMSIPGDIRTAGRTAKPLLRAAMVDKLKPEWLNHPKKGFIFPFDQWLRGPLQKEVEQELLTISTFLFRSGAVQTIWHRFLSDKKQFSAGQIITLYALASWVKRHKIEGIL